MRAAAVDRRADCVYRRNNYVIRGSSHTCILTVRIASIAPTYSIVNFVAHIHLLLLVVLSFENVKPEF